MKRILHILPALLLAVCLLAGSVFAALDQSVFSESIDLADTTRLYSGTQLISTTKGLSGAQIEQALESVYAPDVDGESPELEAAAALVRSRYMKKLADGRRDLVVAALQRRGFAYSVIKEAIKRAEEE